MEVRRFQAPEGEGPHMGDAYDDGPAGTESAAFSTTTYLHTA